MDVPGQASFRDRERMTWVWQGMYDLSMTGNGMLKNCTQMYQCFKSISTCFCILCLSLLIPNRTWPTCVSMQQMRPARTCEYTHTHLYVHTHTHSHTHVHLHALVHLHLDNYAISHTHTLTYINTVSRTHTHTSFGPVVTNAPLSQHYTAGCDPRVWHTSRKSSLVIVRHSDCLLTVGGRHLSWSWSSNIITDILTSWTYAGPVWIQPCLSQTDWTSLL